MAKKRSRKRSRKSDDTSPESVISVMLIAACVSLMGIAAYSAWKTDNASEEPSAEPSEEPSEESSEEA